MDSERREINRIVRAHVRRLIEMGASIESIEGHLYWPEQYLLIAREISGLRRSIDELKRKKDCCALSSTSGQRSDVLQLLTGLDGRLAQERKQVQKRVRNTTHLVICDPYFFSWSGPNRAFARERDYTNYIIGLIERDVRRLEIFHLPGPNARIFSKFKREIGSRNIDASYHETNEIHDRVIIDANDNGTLLGTSFGGLGNKLAFVLDIPTDDVRAFRAQLDRIKST